MRFIVTAELGRLVTWLRILGFDTVLEKDSAAVVLQSLREDRIILTRDSKMSRFSGTRMIRVSSDFVEKQLEQIIRELDINIDRRSLFSRCVLCNEILESVEKISVKGSVPEYVFDTQDSFMKCLKCDKVYWRGTHWMLVNQFLDNLVGLPAERAHRPDGEQPKNSP
ncbi:MAG: Mut7-C RNAse domain-containing protein [Candidatus Omnitrophica bacterium]|nr:Mut7-C RNAse domain-containing protein [Candidatus Omnitrophota bacterium]MCM8791384.1 Mut7-C RNAse domain-containing protein [Candidatus Omnitrophota bacterium]